MRRREDRAMLASTMRRWVLAGTFVLTGGVLSSERHAAAQTAITPFYLEQTLSGESDAGRFGPMQTRTVARRADGTTAIIARVGPAFAGRIRKVIAPSQHAVTVWENTNYKTSWPSQDEDALRLSSQLRVVSPKCLGDREFLRFDTTMNQQVAVVRISVGNHTLTEWRAPALLCEELYRTGERLQPDGSRLLTAETVTTALRLGESDPALFDIDSSYVESEPSVGLRALIRWTQGSVLPPAVEAELRRGIESADEFYHSEARPKP
jgi:hypothetical protein